MTVIVMVLTWEAGGSTSDVSVRMSSEVAIYEKSWLNLTILNEISGKWASREGGIL